MMKSLQSTYHSGRSNWRLELRPQPKRESFRKIGRFWQAIVLLVALFIAVPVHSQYVHTQGTQIVDENNNPIFFSGINLGNWLLWEGYLMMGDFEYRTHTQFFDGVKNAFGGDLGQAIEFEHQWRLNYVNEQTIIDLKNLGFNSVRVPFHFNLFWDYGSYGVTNRGFQYLDRVVNWCRAHDMYVLLDMHAAPGYQNPGDHSDNGNSNSSQPRESVGFWDGDNVNIAAQVWQHIANYYKNEPVVWGYDLINEPVPQPGREYELLPSLQTIRNAIRSVDNNHIIVAEGSWWGSDMQKLDWQDPTVQSATGINYRWDNNLVYQTHHYSNDVSMLNGRKELANRLNVPLMLGEYGENSNNILREMTDWCIDNDVAYFPWSFKKMYHDRCIWTINPSGEYNAVRDYIKYGGTPPANAYNNMIGFCQNNIGNGAAGFTFHQGFYDAVKYTGGAGGGECSGSSQGINQNIEAESYCAMQGVQTENTSDAGGGQNVGWLDAGDWMAFRINIPSSGAYTVEYRVASGGGGGSLQLEPYGGGSPLGTVSVPSTGGWQSWTTVSHTVNFSPGDQDIAISILEGGFNLNWFKITNQGGGNAAPIGQTIWLRGSNGQYVSSENGQGGMYCNRSSVGGWEQFTVVGVGTSQVALQGSNGLYVSSGNGQTPMSCTSTSISGWEAFTWEDQGNNSIALKGFGNQYVSSENGTSEMMCDRTSVGGWEVFTWGTGAANRVSEDLMEETNSSQLIYPNPIESEFSVDLESVGMQRALLSIVDLAGTVVYAQSIEMGAKINLSQGVVPGVYLMVIRNESVTYTRKVKVK